MAFVFLFLDLPLYLVWESLVAFTLQQMPLFHSFLWLSSIPLCVHVCVYTLDIYMWYVCMCVCVCMIHTPYLLIFLICSSLDGHLDCFCVLAFVNSAAINIRMPASFWTVVLSGHMNLSTNQKQTHRHGEQTCGCQGGGVRVGRTGSLGLVDTNSYTENELAMRSYCTAQGTISSLLG